MSVMVQRLTTQTLWDASLEKMAMTTKSRSVVVVGRDSVVLRSVYPSPMTAVAEATTSDGTAQAHHHPPHHHDAQNVLHRGTVPVQKRKKHA